ncbi:hypothetical protein A2U01_0067564, partial [Trifolium medium]|nr:hypothetical protein [Trifolium medium]
MLNSHELAGGKGLRLEVCFCQDL